MRGILQPRLQRLHLPIPPTIPTRLDEPLRRLQTPPRLPHLARRHVQTRPLEVDVAEMELHRSAFGDLLHLVEVGLGARQVVRLAPEGGAGQEATG